MAYTYEFLDHTADIKLNVRASSLEELFSGSVMGIMALAFGEGAERPLGDEEYLSIEADDYESLLIDLLNKLLLRIAVERQRVFEIRLVELEQSRLHVSTRHGAAVPIRDIKAVTWHDVAIVEGPLGYEVTLTLDI